MPQKATLILYLDYLEKFKRLSDEQFGQLIRYAMAYQLTEKIPDIDDPFLAFAFDSVKCSIDDNNVKYEAKIEARRAAGKKGSEARWGKQSVAKIANAKFVKQKIAKIANVAVTDTDTVTDTVTGTVTGTVTDTVTDTVTITDKDIKPEKIKEKYKKENVRYFPNDDLLEKTFADFRENRKKIKHPMTDRAIELMVKKINKMDPDHAVELLEKAIVNGWRDIWETDDRKQTKQTRDPIAEKWGIG